jgi:hypothetical protein
VMNKKLLAIITGVLAILSVFLSPFRGKKKVVKANTANKQAAVEEARAEMMTEKSAASVKSADKLREKQEEVTPVRVEKQNDDAFLSKFTDPNR